jgi:hypothetical protein
MNIERFHKQVTKLSYLFILMCLLVMNVGPIHIARAAAGDTFRVSIDSNGNQGTGQSQFSSMSADGRYVAFESWANNLVSGDTNGVPDIFVRDTQANITTRVSLSSDGAQGYNYPYNPVISANGRYVAFNYGAPLVSNDTNGKGDIFIRDVQTSTTEIVSLDSSGAQGNDSSGYPSLSADGRYLAFESDASNLVIGDTNGKRDIFWRDRQMGITRIVSVSSSGVSGNYHSYTPAISGDGRYVAFQSGASNLVSGDTNAFYDIFVRDMQTDTLTRVSVSSSGVEGNNWSYHPAISANGRYVVFDSGASNLVSGDTMAGDVFVRDTQTNTTMRVSVSSSGAQGNGSSQSPSVSEDGRYVAFESIANNLVEGDTNGSADIFVRDTQANTTTRISVSSSGAQGNSFNGSGRSFISANGQYVAFESSDSNLVSGDTNGQWDIFVHEMDGATTTTITGDSPDPSLVNQSYTVSATVGAASGTPPGTVTVSDGSASCNFTLSGGAGSCLLTSTTAGAKTLTANYTGSSIYKASSGTASHTVNKIPTITSITGDNPDPSLVNQSYVVSVGVTATTGTPTGTVTIGDGTASCTATLSGGSGSCNLTSTTTGTKTLTANYSGDNNYSVSSGTANHTVTNLNTTTTTTITGDNPDPSLVNQSYTVSVTVSAASGIPTGTVTAGDGSVSCNITLLSASGSCSLTSTTSGVKTLTATYSGDGAHDPSSGTASHAVNKIPTITSITGDNPDPSTVNQSYTVSVSVTANSGTPTGTVTISDGSANCTATLSGGSGSCNLASTTTGTKTLTANYSGDNFYSISSGTTSHTVNNSVQYYRLTVNQIGTSYGRVTSSPVGIDCGSDCSEDYPYNTRVELNAAPMLGSVFGGWSGACTGMLNCVVTMTSAKSVTAIFNVPNYTLTVSKTGTGSGTVTSNPAGINCGMDCSEVFSKNTVVTLTASPALDSSFTGWSGDSDCSDSQVTMTTNKSCTAIFTSNTISSLYMADTEGNLRKVNQSTGATTVIGNMGTNYVHGLSNRPGVTNYIFGVGPTGYGGVGPSRLERIDLSTGQASHLPEFSDAVLGISNPTAYGIAISPAAPGVAIVSGFCTNCSYHYYLWRVNVDTGAVQGPAIQTTAWLYEITYNPDGSILYGTDSSGRLVTVNSNSGVVTIVGDPGLSDFIEGLAFRPEDGALFAINAFDQDKLVRLDPTDGSLVQTVGSLGVVGPQGLAFAYPTVGYELSVDKSGSGSGTITSSPDGINCGLDCSEVYSQNTTVILVATPASGSTFMGWSGGGCSGRGNCTVTMTEAIYVKASFIKGQTFADVPPTHPYFVDIEILYANGLTGGCGTNPLKFCPDQIMNRAQAAVFMVRGAYGASLVPHPASYKFKDNWSGAAYARNWAEAMRETNLTSGCKASPLLYCPLQQLNREQAVVFGLKMKYGTNYLPPPATGTVFADMTNPKYWATPWAEKAYADGLITSCGTLNGKPKFCPSVLVTRGLGAYIIVRAKNLSMP